MLAHASGHGFAYRPLTFSIEELHSFLSLPVATSNQGQSADHLSGFMIVRYQQMSLKKDIQRLIDEVQAQGWRVEKRKKHYQCYSPDGRGIVNVSATPSSSRTHANKVSELRRYGFVWKSR